MDKSKNKERISKLELRMTDFEDSFKRYINDINTEKARKTFEPEFEPLPEGVRFYENSQYRTNQVNPESIPNRLFFKFGNNQLIYYSPTYDYLLNGLSSEFKDITKNFHLESCNIEDLKAGDWLLYQNCIYLYISAEKNFRVEECGNILLLKINNSYFEIKRIVYVP